MYHFIKIACLFFILFFSSISEAITKLSFSVSDESGQPISNADLHLSQADNEAQSKTYHFDSKGKLTISLENKELWEAFITAPNKKNIKTYIFPPKANSAVIDVVLADYEYSTDLAKILIINNVTGLARSKAVPFIKQENGTYLFEVETNEAEFKYQLVDADANGHTINGQTQTKFEYDGGGDYFSIISVVDEKVAVMLDPKAISSSQQQSSVKFLNPEMANSSELLMTFTQWQTQWYSDENKYKKEKGELDGYSVDDSLLIAKIKSVLESAPLQQKQIALVGNMYLKKPLEEFAEQAIKMIPVESKLWSLKSGGMAAYTIMTIDDKDNNLSYENKFGIGIKKNAKFFKEFLAQPFNIKAKKKLLNFAVYGFKAIKETQLARNYYTILETNYPEDKMTKDAAFILGDNNKVKVGEQVPDFEFTSIDNSLNFTPASMKGKLYLIDFWATWCSPCLEEMSYLHRAADTFDTSQFEIVSVSIDSNLKLVTDFRSKKWNMPWKNVWIDKKQYKEIKKSFEINGIPKALLIDAQGKIIAMDVELKHESLIQVVKSFLEKKPS